MDGAQIECKANNTLVSNPTIRSLDLEMYCKYSSKYTAYNSKCCLCASISEAIKGGYQNDWKYGRKTKIQSPMHSFWFQTTSRNPMVHAWRKTRLAGVSYRKNYEIVERERKGKESAKKRYLLFPYLYFLISRFTRSHMHSDDTVLIRKYLHGNPLRPLVSSITWPSPSIMDWIWPARRITPGSSGILSKIPEGLIFTVRSNPSFFFISCNAVVIFYFQTSPRLLSRLADPLTPIKLSKEMMFTSNAKCWLTRKSELCIGWKM